MFVDSPRLVVAVGVGVAAGWWATRRVLSARLDTVRYEATHDPLTGVLNRAGLAAAGPVMVSGSARPVGVGLVDLVGFKKVNDRYGHDAGDAVLVATARRLAVLAGPDGVVARLGGDEFVILAHADVPHSGWPDRVHAALTRPVAAGGCVVAVGATVGVTVADPSLPLSAWLSAADHAMYAARAARTTTGFASPPGSAGGCERSATRRRDLARPSSHVTAAAVKAA